MRALIAWTWIAAAACYAPSAPAGAPCGDGEACPSGQVCAAGVCTREGEVPVMYADAPAEGEPPDGEPPDGEPTGSDAPVDAPGAPAWRSTTSLPSPRSLLCAVVVDGVLYAIGGGPLATVGTEVLAASIADNGTLGAWEPQAPLPQARRWQACAADPASRTIFVVGGDGTSGIQSTVVRATVSATGQISAWLQAVPLPEPRRGLGLVATGKAIFAIGGEVAAGFVLRREVFAAELENGGGLGDWTEVRNLPEPDYMFGAVTDGSSLVLTGGYAADAAVYRASIGLGSLGPLSATTPLPARRQRHVSVLVNGFVYAIGGMPDLGNPNLTSVVRAPLDAGGGLGAWESLPDLPLPIAYAGGATDGRHIFVVGGSDDDGARASVFVFTP